MYIFTVILRVIKNPNIVCVCVCVRVCVRERVCVIMTLFSPNVLVRAKPHPCSKALLIIAVLVVGGADARPNGLGNLIPQTSTLMST